MSPASPLSRWYYAPLVVIIAACLVAMVNFGVRSSFGLFTAPISEAHAWPRETYSLAMAVQNLLWGLATPLAGALADRHGAARVLMAGAVIYCLCTMLAIFEPGTSGDAIFASLTRAGALGAYRELPISPTIAGCFALADAKVASFLAP